MITSRSNGRRALAVLVVAVLAMTWSHGGSAGTQAANPGDTTQMDIVINGGQCDSSVQSKCSLTLDSVFTVSIVPSIIPPNGYTGWQTLFDYGSLRYKPTVDPTAELKWDQGPIAVRLPEDATGEEGQIAHSDVSGVFLPHPVSTQKTSFLNLTFNCARNAGGGFSQVIALIDSEMTTKFIEPGATPNFPNVGSIEINCLPKLPKPGDTDGDGCPDEHENGPDETQGGQRNYLDPNDFYDVLGPTQSLTLDGVIDLPNDILGVVRHFSPLGTEPEYDVRFDRGPQTGANTWNMGPPDGVIDLPNDVLGVLQQFGHNCV